MRRLLVMLVRAASVLALIAASACGIQSASEAVSEDEPAMDASSGASASRIDSVRVEGSSYEVTCARPDEGSFGEEHAFDEPDPRFDRVVAIEAEAGAVALHAVQPIDRCPDVAWVLALRSGHMSGLDAAKEQARLRCALPAVPDDPRCSEGGPFWYGTDPTADGTAGDGRSAVWVAAREPEPGWRLDPLEVVARDVAPESNVADFYRLRRVGLRLLRSSADRVVVEVIYQDLTPNGDGFWGSDQREHHALSRLPGRDGWYQSEFVVHAYANENLDGETLDSRWPAMLDRVLVEVDRRQQ